jgi:tetratricopeptide (TPR) repeat protein
LKVIALKQQSEPESANNDPALADIRDKLAKSFRLNNQRDDAIATLKQLIKENPLRYETYELLAELYAEKDDYSGVLANLQQMLLLNPGQPANHVRVADLLIKTKEFDKAITALTDARMKFPQLPILTYYLALAQSQAKKNGEAVVTFEEALHEAENSQPDMLDGRFYFTYGVTAEQAGLYEKAAELMKKSVELDPSNAAEAYNYIGYMWTERGEKLDEAGDFIKRAVELDPENPAYLDSLGWWFYKKNEPQKAVEQLEKAVANLKLEDLKSDDAVIYEHAGDAYTKLNNVAQALVFWQKAVVIDPSNKGIADKLENAKQKVAHQTAPAEVRP